MILDEALSAFIVESRELLPVEQQAQVEGEEEGEDPRWELIRQLVEYKKFKDAAGRLQEIEATQENVYRRTAPKLEFEAPAQRVQVSIFDLVNAVNGILKRFTAADSRDIFEDKWTVSEKIETIVNLIRERPAVKFSELFAAATSRTEVVVTFLAMLELIRLKQIVIAQPEAFAEIEISQAPPQPVAPPEPAAEPAPAGELNLRMN